MTAAAIISLIRRRIAQSDLVTSTVTDTELMDYVQEAADRLSLRPVTGFSDLVMDTSAITITPEPTLEQGYMLGLYATLLYMEDEYTGKLATGSLGVSWSSGIESESTISAEKAWSDALGQLEEEVDSMILVKWGPITGTRPQ